MKNVVVSGSWGRRPLEIPNVHVPHPASCGSGSRQPAVTRST